MEMFIRLVFMAPYLRVLSVCAGISAFVLQVTPASAYPASKNPGFTVFMKYTTVKPKGDWTSAKFNDSKWKVGHTPFGTLPSSKTRWAGHEIWIRIHLEKVTILPHRIMTDMIGIGDLNSFMDGRKWSSIGTPNASGKGTRSAIPLMVPKGSKVLAMDCVSGAPRRVIILNWENEFHPPRPATLPASQHRI